MHAKRINHRAIKAALQTALRDAIRDRDRELVLKVSRQLSQYKEVRHGRV